MPRTSEARMTVTEAGKQLGMSALEIMNAMRRGAFPFAVALPPDDTHERWRYIIPRKRFNAWLEGIDMKPYRGDYDDDSGTNTPNNF